MWYSPAMNLHDLCVRVKDESKLFTDSDCPFALHPEAGETNARALVVVGDNAEGKSLLVQVLSGWAHKEAQMAPLTVSIRERTGSGLHEMGGMRRAMMFGDESAQSTGHVSVSTANRAFSSAEGWARDGKKPFMVLDEPDMGLSEGYAAAFGTHLARRLHAMPEDVRLVLVSHSRALVGAFRAECQALGAGRPHFTFLGAEPWGFDRWLATAPTHSVDDLLALGERAQERRRTVARMIR